MASSKPLTYGDLLTILESTKRQALEGDDRSTAELLTVELHHKFPHIRISRPGRFLDTVRRIAAPIQQSRQVLQGTPLNSYLKRTWRPYQNTCTKYVNLYLSGGGHGTV